MTKWDNLTKAIDELNISDAAKNKIFFLMAEIEIDHQDYRSHRGRDKEF